MSERLRARWGQKRGVVELYDPVRREWHALVAKGLPRWIFDLLPGRRRRPPKPKETPPHA